MQFLFQKILGIGNSLCRFSLVIGTLAIKAARLVQFYRLKHTVPKISDFVLLRSLFVYVLGVAAVCGAASYSKLTQPVTFITFSQYAHDGVAFFRQCDMGTLNHFKSGIQGFSILLALIISHSTSDIPAPFHEGNWM